MSLENNNMRTVNYHHVHKRKKEISLSNNYLAIDNLLYLLKNVQDALLQSNTIVVFRLRLRKHTRYGVETLSLSPSV